MTRTRYGFVLIGIVALSGAVMVATSFAIVTPPLSGYLTGPGTRSENVLLSLLALIWWLAAAPLWTWATAARYARRALPRWPALLPGGLSLLAILTVLLASLTLAPEAPGVPDPFASVEEIMQETEGAWFSRYVLSQIVTWSNLVMVAAVVLAIGLSAFNFRRDPAPDHEAFE